MKILVTGADGYIGTVLCPKLLERGYDVVGADAGFYRRGWLFEDGQTRPMVISRDIRLFSVEDLRGFDSVIHLAELSNDPLGRNDPEVMVEVNHRGSTSFARACKAAGVSRFLYASSCSIYGGHAGEIKCEDSRLDPQTVNARCKALNEAEMLRLMDDNFAPVFLRSAVVYGTSPRQRFDLVLNQLCAWAHTKNEIRIASDGSAWRPIVHVQDVCEAMICALEAPREVVAGQALNVGDDAHNFRIRDIAEIVRSSFPGCRVSFGQKGESGRSYRVSFNKIRSSLTRFKCRWTPARGAAELSRLFDRIGLDMATFQAAPYTRSVELEYLQSTRQVDEHLFWTTAGSTRAKISHRLSV